MQMAISNTFSSLWLFTLSGKSYQNELMEEQDMPDGHPSMHLNFHQQCHQHLRNWDTIKVQVETQTICICILHKKVTNIKYVTSRSHQFLGQEAGVTQCSSDPEKLDFLFNLAFNICWKYFTISSIFVTLLKPSKLGHSRQ